MNDKVLIITILSLLVIGFGAVGFLAVSWTTNIGFSRWKDLLLDDGIIILAIVLFIYGFYMNMKMD